MGHARTRVVRKVSVFCLCVILCGILCCPVLFVILIVIKFYILLTIITTTTTTMEQSILVIKFKGIFITYVCNNFINNDECLSKSHKNKIFQQHGHAGKRRVEKTCWPPSLQYFFLQEIIHINTFNALFILKYICM